MSPDLQYHVDIVLCIDCSGSMASVIESLKKNVCNIPKDLNAALEQKSKGLSELRIRIVAFSDLNAIKASNFFVVGPICELIRKYRYLRYRKNACFERARKLMLIGQATNRGGPTFTLFEVEGTIIFFLNFCRTNHQECKY